MILLLLAVLSSSARAALTSNVTVSEFANRRDTDGKDICQVSEFLVYFFIVVNDINKYNTFVLPNRITPTHRFAVARARHN